MALIKYEMRTKVLHSIIGSNKVALVKALRNAFGVGLKEAKDMMDKLVDGEILFHETTFEVKSQYLIPIIDFGVSVNIIDSVDFDIKNFHKIVYVVKKNSDMSEGRGPKIVDSIFSNRTAAVEYMDKQPGIMGRTGKWSEDGYGDWKIEEMFLFDSANQREEAVIAEHKENALKKLTDYEKKILGLS